GDRVQTTDKLKVRKTPAGTLLGVQAKGAKGTVIGGPKTSSNGVVWYQVSYDKAPRGWSAQGWLVKVGGDVSNKGGGVVKNNAFILGKSGRSFTYNGEPAYLVGFDKQEIVSDPTSNYVASLDTFQKYNINKVRIWLYTWFHENKYVNNSPWKYSNGKFDLDTWNDAYWVRVKDFIKEAAKRDIAVEITIFAPYPGADWWSNNKTLAWLKENNINGAFSRNNSGTMSQFFNLNYSEKSNSGKTLRQYQEALIDKTATELGSFGNVYFEIANEFGAYANISRDYLWQNAMAKRLANKTNRLVSVHAQEANKNTQFSYANKPYVDVMNYRVFGTGSSVDYSPSGSSKMFNPVQRSGKILSVNESSGIGNIPNIAEDIDANTQYAWGVAMSGASFAFYQDKTITIGDSVWIAAAKRLRAIRTVFEAANFSTLSPVDSNGKEYDSLVSSGPGDKWQVMANPGTRYLVYFWGNKSNKSAVINGTSGAYSYAWYDTRDARVVASGKLNGNGKLTIIAPNTSQWNGKTGLALFL
ncbi:hypothetical protein MNBD_BACTEROID05-1296, partial [hydrothermal vent metagenome]